MRLSAKSAANSSFASVAINSTYLILLVLLSSRFAGAQEINIAAASDLEFVLKEVTFRFTNETGKHVQVSFGSSGNFFSLIENGAPFDLFFSADIEYPQKLEAEGLAEPETLYQYARGRIVLWVANESGIDIIQGLKTLLEPKVKKVAIAKPTHARFGRA